MEITSSFQAYQYLAPRIRLDVEEVWVIALDSQKKVIQSEMIFRGTVDRCFFHPRDAFRFAIRHNASALLMAHGHPSNQQYPSQQDINITRDMWKASQLLQIPMVDHLIITAHGYLSLAEVNLLKFSRP